MDKTVISVRRHEAREKLPEGAKLCHITKEAYGRALYYGKTVWQGQLPGKILGFSSEEDWAKETLQAILEGAGVQHPETAMTVTSALNEIKFHPGYRKELDQIADYDSRINHLLQHPDTMAGAESMPDSGKRAIRHIREVYHNARTEGGVLYLENVTHGPLPEAALIQLVEPQIKDIRYLHGGFREGEGFRIEIEGGQWEVYFRGEKVIVPEVRIDEL